MDSTSACAISKRQFCIQYRIDVRKVLISPSDQFVNDNVFRCQHWGVFVIIDGFHQSTLDREILIMRSGEQQICNAKDSMCQTQKFTAAVSTVH